MSHICLIRSGNTDQLELTVYTSDMKKVTVIRCKGLAIKHCTKQLPTKTEFFFDKFLVGWGIR